MLATLLQKRLCRRCDTFYYKTTQVATSELHKIFKSYPVMESYFNKFSDLPNVKFYLEKFEHKTQSSSVSLIFKITSSLPPIQEGHAWSLSHPTL